MVDQRLDEIDARGVNSIPLRATGPTVRRSWCGSAATARTCRRRRGRAAGQHPRRHRARRADHREGDRAARGAAATASSAPTPRPATRCGQGRALRPVRHHGRARGLQGRPADGSLFKSMSPETLTLDEALELLTLPRSVGAAPDGEEIQALNGRYGPYLKKGTDSRSLDNEEQLFTVTLDEALAIFAQPKQRGRRAAAAPLRSSAPTRSPRAGHGPGGPVRPLRHRRRDQRRLRKGDDVEAITLERAPSCWPTAGPAGRRPRRRPPRSRRRRRRRRRPRRRRQRPRRRRRRPRRRAG